MYASRDGKNGLVISPAPLLPALQLGATRAMTMQVHTCFRFFC